MRIELTRDASQRPANGFEDRGGHQPPYIPGAVRLARAREVTAHTLALGPRGAPAQVVVDHMQPR